MNKFTITKNGYSKEEVDAYVEQLESQTAENLASQKKRIFELKSQLTESENKLKAFNQMSGRINSAIVSAVAKAEEIEKYSMQKLQFEIDQLKAFHERWQEYYLRIIDKYPLDDDLVSINTFNSSMSKILSSSTAQYTKPPVESPVAQFLPNSLADINNVQKLNIVANPVNMPKSASLPNDAIEEGYRSEKSRLATNSQRVANHNAIINETAPTLDGSSSFNPVQKIDKFYRAQQPKSASGFSFDEALHPEQDLKDILKDLGLLLDGK